MTKSFVLPCSCSCAPPRLTLGAFTVVRWPCVTPALGQGTRCQREPSPLSGLPAEPCCCCFLCHPVVLLRDTFETRNWGQTSEEQLYAKAPPFPTPEILMNIFYQNSNLTVLVLSYIHGRTPSEFRLFSFPAWLSGRNETWGVSCTF